MTLHSSRDVFDNIRRAIGILRKSRVWDWDGKGALPIRPDSCDIACNLFAEPLSKVVGQLPEAGVVAETDGTISLLFAGVEGALSLNFKGDVAISYRKSWGDDTSVEGLIRLDHTEPLAAVDDLATFVELLQWLIDGA